MSVDQTETVDAIGVDKATGKTLLSISDHLPWSDDHLLILQKKLNSYLRYLESGEVYDSYPSAKGREFVIQLYLKYRPTDLALHFLEQVRETINSAGFDLVFGPLSQGYCDDDG